MCEDPCAAQPVPQPCPSMLTEKKDPDEQTLVSSVYGQGLKEKIPANLLCLPLIENHPRPIRN